MLELYAIFSVVAKRNAYLMKRYLSPLQSARTITVLVLLLIIAAIPLTVYIAQQQQQIQQHAASTSPSASLTATADSVLPPSGTSPSSVTGSTYALNVKTGTQVTFTVSATQGQNALMTGQLFFTQISARLGYIPALPVYNNPQTGTICGSDGTGCNFKPSWGTNCNSKGYCQIGSDQNLSGSNQFTIQWTPTAPGSYVVSANITDTPSEYCSGNPFVNYPYPVGSTPQFQWCGDPSWVYVYVADAPIQWPANNGISSTCSKDGTTNTISWNPVPGATLYLIRLNNDDSSTSPGWMDTGDMTIDVGNSSPTCTNSQCSWTTGTSGGSVYTQYCQAVTDGQCNPLVINQTLPNIQTNTKYDFSIQPITEVEPYPYIASAPGQAFTCSPAPTPTLSPSPTLTPTPTPFLAIQGELVNTTAGTKTLPDNALVDPTVLVQAVALDGIPQTAPQNPYSIATSLEQHTVSIPVPPNGYSIGYTLCYYPSAPTSAEVYQCHFGVGVSQTSGTAVTVNPPSGDLFASLYWHFTPPAPTPTLSPSPTTAPTSAPNPISISLSLKFAGVGNAAFGDNTQPTANNLSKQVTLCFYPPNSQLTPDTDPNCSQGTQANGTVTYAKGQFTNIGAYQNTSFPVGTSLAPGNYDIYILLPNYLHKKLQNQAISNGAFIPLTTLIPGDLNGDNQIDSDDWNMVVRNCFGKSVATTPPCVTADLNFDGMVNETDVNIITNYLGSKGD